MWHGCASVGVGERGIQQHVPICGKHLQLLGVEVCFTAGTWERVQVHVGDGAGHQLTSDAEPILSRC